MKTRPYYLKTATSICLAIGAAYGISLIGIPPPRYTVIEKQFPVELKLQEKEYHAKKDFAYMSVFVSGKEFCRIPSTTSVRNYFKSGEGFQERTRIEREVCQVPEDTNEVYIEINFPYRPRQNKMKTTLDSCEEFKKGEEGWFTECTFPMVKGLENITFQAYEHIEMEQLRKKRLKKGRYQLMADRINVSIIK